MVLIFRYQGPKGAPGMPEVNLVCRYNTLIHLNVHLDVGTDRRFGWSRSEQDHCTNYRWSFFRCFTRLHHWTLCSGGALGRVNALLFYAMSFHNQHPSLKLDPLLSSRTETRSCMMMNLFIACTFYSHYSSSRIDTEARQINWMVDEGEQQRRSEEWKVSGKEKLNVRRGILYRYAREVQPASLGAFCD